MYKIKCFREELPCVIVPYSILMFISDQLLLADMFSQLYYLTYTKKKRWWTYVIMKNIL